VGGASPTRIIWRLSACHSNSVAAARRASYTASVYRLRRRPRCFQVALEASTSEVKGTSWLYIRLAIILVKHEPDAATLKPRRGSGSSPEVLLDIVDVGDHARRRIEAYYEVEAHSRSAWIAATILADVRSSAGGGGADCCGSGVAETGFASVARGGRGLVDTSICRDCPEGASVIGIGLREGANIYKGALATATAPERLHE